MTSLTFYGGVNEVGGNKILLEDKDTKVFLDFGMSFGKRGAYFDEFMSPRIAAGLRDFFEMGLIPKLDGSLHLRTHSHLRFTNLVFRSRFSGSTEI